MESVISNIYSLPYYIIFIALFCLAIVVNSKSFKQKKKETYLSFILLVVFIGLRGYVYSDWISYLAFFKEVPLLFDLQFCDLTERFIFEPGFIVYTSCIKSICNNFHFFIFLSSLIDLWILLYAFEKYLKNPLLGFAMFFAINGLSMEFNLLRNMKSIMLFLISLRFIQEKSFFKYLICNSIGFFFHQTSLIYIPLYFVLGKNWSRKFIILLFVFANLIYLFQIPICQPIILKIVELVGGDIMIRKAISYFTSNVEYGFSIAYIERVIIFLIVLSFYSRITIRKTNLLFVNIFVLYFLMYSLCWDMNIVSARGSILFILGYWFVIPLIVENISIKRNLILFYAYIFFICSYKVVLNNNNIMARYDNLLFGIESVEKRTDVLNRNLHNLLK